MASDYLLLSPRLRHEVGGETVKLIGGRQEIELDLETYHHAVLPFSEVEHAYALIDTLARDSATRADLAELIFSLVNYGILHEVEPPEPPRPMWRTNVVRINPQSDQLFVLFTDRKRSLVAPIPRFLRESKIGEHNRIVLFDGSRNNYLLGTNFHISSFRQLLAWIRGVCAAMPHVRSVHCVGTRHAAHPAMMAGYYLEADSVTTYALPYVDRPVGVDFDDELDWNLADMLADPNDKTSYRVVNHEGSERQKKVCETLADREGVVTELVQEGPAVVGDLIKKGRLRETLTRT